MSARTTTTAAARKKNSKRVVDQTQPPASALKDRLEALALGEMEPADALAHVRASFDAGSDSMPEIYDALRALAWKKFAERIFGDEMTPWHDLFRQASGLFDINSQAEFANKMSAFADLAIESVRFGRTNALQEILARAHVHEILTALGKHGGTALRTVLMSDTGLKEANLSRVLAHMAANGLIDRRPSGRQVTVMLASLGREALLKPRPPGSGGLTVYPPLGSRGNAGAKTGFSVR